MPGKEKPMKIESWQLERFALAELPEDEMQAISLLVKQSPALQKELKKIQDDNLKFFKKYPADLFISEVSTRLERIEKREQARSVKGRVLHFINSKKGKRSLSAVAAMTFIGIGVSYIYIPKLQTNPVEALAEKRALSFNQELGDDRRISDNIGRQGQATKVAFGTTVNRPARNPKAGFTEPGDSLEDFFTRGKISITQNGRQQTFTFEPRILLPRRSNVPRRMLEYQVNVDFEASDFNQARSHMLGLVDQYGFVKSSQSRFNEEKLVNSTFYVQSDQLYKFLQNLDGVGRLKSEKIQTVDHTGSNFEKQVVIDRERLRQRRRSRQLSGSHASKNFAEREKALAASEDSFDRARVAHWHLKDRVKWAQVNVNLQTPAGASQVQVPEYGNAFVNLVNGFLTLTLYLLYFLPVAGILALGFVYREKIVSLFKRG